MKVKTFVFNRFAGYGYEGAFVFLDQQVAKLGEIEVIDIEDFTLKSGAGDMDITVIRRIVYNTLKENVPEPQPEQCELKKFLGMPVSELAEIYSGGSGMRIYGCLRSFVQDFEVEERHLPLVVDLLMKEDRIAKGPGGLKNFGRKCLLDLNKFLQERGCQAGIKQPKEVLDFHGKIWEKRRK